MNQYECSDNPTALTIPPPADNIPTPRDSFHVSLDRALAGETGWEQPCDR